MRSGGQAEIQYTGHNRPTAWIVGGERAARNTVCVGPGQSVRVLQATFGTSSAITRT